MKSEDIVFDEHMEMSFFQPELNAEVCLVLSDGN